MLELQKIIYQQDNTQVLDQVDLALKPGTITAVMSLERRETSALLDILAGVRKPQAGQIVLDGQVLEFNRQDRGALGINLIPGVERLFPHLSIIDNLTVGLRLRQKHGRIPFKQVMDQVRPFTEYFGLNRPLDTLVRDLNRGDQQLLSVILACLQKGNYLLVRDVLSSLTISQYEKFKMKMLELRAQGRAIAIVPDTPSQAFDFCDNLAVLRNGRLIYGGKTADLEIDEVHNLLNNSEHLIRQALENKFHQFRMHITSPGVLFDRALKVLGNFCGITDAFILAMDPWDGCHCSFSKYWKKESHFGLTKGGAKLVKAIPKTQHEGILTLGESSFYWCLVHQKDAPSVLLAVEGREKPRFPFGDYHKELILTYQHLVLKLDQEKQDRERELRSVRLNQELDIARKIQNSILPRNLVLEGYDIAASMETATEIGGDSYDVLPTALGNFISIGDVSGHGLPSGIMALIEMSAMHGVIQSHLALGLTPEPNRIYDIVNKVLCEINRDRIGSDKFMTKILLIERGGQFFHAGTHEIGLCYRRAEDRIVEMDRMIDHTGFLGISEMVDSSQSLGSFELAEGDFLFLYTDGLIEAMDQEGTQFGIDRVKEVLWKNRTLGSRDLLPLVRDAVFSFAADGDVRKNQGRLADDLTLFLIRRTLKKELS